MPQAPIRTGLIGYGLAGQCFHAPFLATTPGLRLSAIVSRDGARQRLAQQAHPDARVLSTTDQLWNIAGDLDLVVVATPNRAHVPLGYAAIEASLDVVIEKPVAPTASEARALIATARQRGRLLTVFQNRRWDGDFLTLQRLVRECRLGQPMRFESRFERWRPEPRPGWRERAEPEEAGGLLFDLGSHLVDQALLLFGPAETVYAEVDRRRPGAAVDDDTFVALTHRSGVRSHLFMSATAGQLGPRFRLLGSSGAYTKFGMDVQEEALRAGQRPDVPGWGEEPADRWGLIGSGDQLQRVPTEAGSYQEFYAGIVRAIHDGAPAPVDPDGAVSTLEVLEAARRSSAELRVVAVIGAD
jgi:predicted dehydrogenase